MNTLHTEKLMAHMRVLCQDIGPRPSASKKERQAAEYVKDALHKVGVSQIQEQPFTSRSSLGWVIIPPTIVAIAAIPLALLGGTWGLVTGGLLLALGGCTMREFFLMKPVFFERLIARGHSQNVIATLPASGPAQRKVFLVGHLDSNKQRFLAPPPNPAYMKLINTASQITPVLFGLFFVMSAFTVSGSPWWLWLIGLCGLLALLPSLGLSLYDETQPHIEGANDNATAVSILLSLTEALKTQPLSNTEVTLLFTGCEEVGCAGMEAYLQQFAPPKIGTYWIDLEMVGAGQLCYVTQHGVSYTTQYAPAPEMVKLAAQTAQAQPELGVTGKDMLIVEEVASLRRRGYRAICLAGYNQQGYLPNWHRLSDTLEHIESDTLIRAAHYTWALLQTIDRLPA